MKKYITDPILKQQFFEPSDWALSFDEQISNINKYLHGARYDKEKLLNYFSQPKKRGYSRVIVPKISFLAEKCSIKGDPFLNLGMLVEHVCSIIGSQRPFTHYRKNALGSEYLRPVPELVKKRRSLEKYADTDDDLLVLDVSLGPRYAGWTPRRAKYDITTSPNIVALSIVDVLWIVLINPLRFTHCDDMSTDSVMEEYFSEDRSWECVLFMYFRGGRFEFGYRWGRRAYFDSGAAVAFAKDG